MGDGGITIAGDFGPVARTLVTRVSDAVGGLAGPWQTRRMAKAEADARVIAAEAEGRIARALSRHAKEEERKQLNMEEVLRLALPHLNEDARPGGINEDWIVNLMEKCRVVSDADMQELWARLLAGESNRPGCFSRRTVNLVADLDAKSARTFANFCQFKWTVNGNPEVLVTQFGRDSIYEKNDIAFMDVVQLESLGLVRYSNRNYGFNIDQETTVFASYGTRQLELAFDASGWHELRLGLVTLTQACEQLLQLVAITPVAGFFEHIQDWWLEIGSGMSLREIPEEATE